MSTSSHKIPENLAISSCKPVQASFHMSCPWCTPNTGQIKSHCIDCSFPNRPSCFSHLELCAGWMPLWSFLLWTTTLLSTQPKGHLQQRVPALQKNWWPDTPLCFCFSMKTLKHYLLWLCCGFSLLDCRRLEILGCLPLISAFQVWSTWPDTWC